MIQSINQPANNVTDTLEAVLINSNFRTILHRHVIPPKFERRFKMCVSAGGGVFNLPIGECRLDVDMRDNATLLHLWHGRSPVAVSGVSTAPLGAPELWEFLMEFHVDQTALGKFVDCSPELERPCDDAWLAVSFAPTFWPRPTPTLSG